MKRTIARVLLVAVLTVVAVAAIVYGRFVRDLEAADASFARQDRKAAAARYEGILSTFERYPALKSMLRREFETAVFHQTQLLYHEGKYDQAVTHLETQSTQFQPLGTTATFHLLMGNALFRVAILREGNSLSSESLQTVAQEYQESLRLAPANWDAKHNYEFIRMLQEKKAAGQAREDKNLQILLSAIRLTTEERRGALPDKLH